MRTSISFGCFFAAIISVSAMCSISFASAAPPQFHLCSSIVEATSLGPAIDSKLQLVHIKLSSTGASAFAEFTRIHQGEVIEVWAGSSLVASATVQTVISSGRIQSTAHPEAEAVALRGSIDASPLDPCGSDAVLHNKAMRPDVE